MKSRELKFALCRFLACVVLGVLCPLSGDISGSQSTWCKTNACNDSTATRHSMYCCQIYNACIQQCGGACSPMKCFID